MAQVELDKPVPALSLPSTSGADFTLSDARGSWLIVYFYPKDSTPGCTSESEDFRDLLPKFKKVGALIVGISRDSLASHAKFRDKLQLPFHLLSDAEETACGLFDVIREKNMYGRKVMGIERSTFAIDPKGVLRQQWRKVKVAGHAEQVLEYIQSAG